MNHVRKRKNIIGAILFLLLILTVCLFYYARGSKPQSFVTVDPYVRLTHCDKDSTWLILMDIKSHQSDSAFDRFLQRILDKNNFEMNSVTEATRYVAYKDRRDFLPLLKMKYAQLENIPKDSTWKVLIAENY